jgi:general secretion pathway protein B
MSYILDALKRADAERERGAVPGLHAQQNAALAAAPVARSRMRLWLITATVVTLSAIAAGLWLWRAPADEASLASVQLAMVPPVVSTPAIAPVATPAPTPTPTAAPVATPTAVALPTPGSASTPAPAVAVQAPVATAPATAAVAVHRAEPKAAPPQPVAKATAGAKAATAAASPASSAPVAAPAVPLLGELPEDIRRQIPALVITGAVYSETPAQRLLLVNNQVLNQGSQAAPEVTLEEIRPKSSVFSFRGTRFRLTH